MNMTETMRTIARIGMAKQGEMFGLRMYDVFPMGDIDPFLLLHHHGPHRFPPHNAGFPEEPHPHRGMQTVTFLLDGEMNHRDNIGNHGTLRAGGVEWLSAGKGLQHMGELSEDFKARGGTLQIMQLWVNLPARLKMSEPRFRAVQKEEIPTLNLDNGNVTAGLVAGAWDGQPGALGEDVGVDLSTIRFRAGGRLALNIPADRNILFYVARGGLRVNGNIVDEHGIAQFRNDGTALDITADDDALLLLGHAKPLGEPVAARGPFVMNTDLEIRQAYLDFRNGIFGAWN